MNTFRIRLALLLICTVLLAACSLDGNVGSSNGTSGSRIEPGSASGNCFPTGAPGATEHAVTAWMAVPSDALITHPITGLTVRQAFAPQWAGDGMRLRLNNRYSSLPVTLENVHIARESEAGSAAMVPGSTCRLLFNGQTKVTIAPGESVYSDWASYPVRPFQRVGVSFYAPEFTPQLTRHLSSNEALYISGPGDFSANADGSPFFRMPDGYISNFLVIDALEVAAPKSVSTLVAVGDSITDGSDSTTAFLNAGPPPMVATDQRYPNHLQRLILQLGLPFAVANAGIGGNELLSEGMLPQFGPALLSRLDADVLKVSGASHVLLMIGTNDFGNVGLGTPPTSAELIAGYQKVVERVHAAGLKIILGTIPPAEGTVSEGLPMLGSLPFGIPVLHGTAQARRGRDEVNTWIRQQAESDGVVDFAACLEDKNRPGFMASQYNSGDNLHPNPAGYEAMARCVDLNVLLNDR